MPSNDPNEIVSTREQNVAFARLQSEGVRPKIGWAEPDGSEYVATLKGDFYILPNGALLSARQYQIERGYLIPSSHFND